MNVLIVGGAGYIGSVTTNLFINKGHSVVVFDNLETGSEKLIHPDCVFFKGDLRKISEVKKIFSTNHFDLVIHFGSFSVNEESVQNPDKYFLNNVGGTLNLLHTMIEYKVLSIIFSSTAAIFSSNDNPICETDKIGPASPYGKTKAIIEKILLEYDLAYNLRSVSLRYFNAGGASCDGRFGELHNPETHLIPLAITATERKIDSLQIFGNDYPTPDGTCLRDYIHVEDLARAHFLSANYLTHTKKTTQFNLGAGKATSVLEIISETEKITGKKIKLKIKNRRPGDPPVLIANCSKANHILGWKPQYSLSDIIRDAWKWHSSN